MQLFIESTGFGVVLASILAIGGVGFTLQWGVANFLNLAYVDFMVLAAFLDYTFANRLHLGFWLSAVISILLVASGSVVMNKLLIQPLVRRGIRFFNLLIVAFGVGTVIQYGIQAIWGPAFFQITVPGNRSLHFIDMRLTVAQLVVIGIAIASMLLLHLLLVKTDLGRAMRAVSANPVLAQCSGIRVAFIFDMAWFLSGILCGIAGLVLAINASSFDSSSGANYLAELLAVVVVGGIGSPYGAMAAAVIIGLISEWATIVNSYFDIVVALAALIVVLFFRPYGLFRSLTSAEGGGTA